MLNTAKKASNAVLAKARAMYGRRLTDDDYKDLASCRSMPELAGALKSKPLYAPALTDINPVFARRAGLELDLRKSIFSRYASLCQYDLSAGQSVYRYFILCSDIEEITTLLRYLDSGHPGDYLYVLPDFLEKHTKLDLYRLARVTNLEELLRALKGTPYGEALAPLRGMPGGTSILEKAEPILAQMSHKALVALAGERSKNSGTAPGMWEYVALECDVTALSNLARMKRMQVPGNRARHLTMNDCSALSNAEWEKLLGACDLAEFQKEFSTTVYGRAMAQVGGSYFKERLNKMQYHWCLKWLRFSTDPTLVMLCYVFLAKNEVYNLNHIIEGVHYGLGADAILPLLIGYQLAA